MAQHIVIMTSMKKAAEAGFLRSQRPEMYLTYLAPQSEEYPTVSNG